jgi:hypothetical protein
MQSENQKIINAQTEAALQRIGEAQGDSAEWGAIGGLGMTIFATMRDDSRSSAEPSS